MMFVVTVKFTIHQEHAEEFRPLILANASASVELEEGCHRFDVAISPDGRDIFLYELYSNKAAFEVHLKSEHFQAFESAASGMVASKRVECFTLALTH